MNKKTFTNKKRKAFSLIELSIVLIIIGLLIAGVTGGASLVKNSELRKITEEARGYQTAVNSFFAKYNSIPGDYNVVIGTMTSTTSLTANVPDNLIQYYTAVSTYTNNSRLESNIAWQQLKNDNFIGDSFTFAAGDTTGATSSGTSPAINTSNSPSSKSKGGTWTFDTITVNSVVQNVVVLTAGVPAITNGASAAISLTAITLGGASASATNNSQLIPTEALSIDSKVDDGVANTGKVSSMPQLTNNNCNGAATATYTTANNYKACSLAFQVDPNS